MESEAQPQAQPTEPAPGSAATPNLIQRIGMVFFGPGALGRALQDRAPWFWTLAVVVIINIVIILVTPGELLLQAVEASARGGQQAPDIGVTQMRAFGIGGIVFGAFVGAAIIAGALYLLFNILFGLSEIGYKQHLSVIAHAWWITLLGSIIAFPLQIAQNDATLRLGLGLLLGGEPSSYLGFVLQNITIFGIWAVFAVGAMESGLSRGKVTTGKAGTAVLVLYVIVAAVMGALQSLGAS